MNFAKKEPLQKNTTTLVIATLNVMVKKLNLINLCCLFNNFFFTEIPAVNKTIIKRDTQQPIVGQSNPATAHNRLIQQRARQRLHQQQQRSHHITTPTHRRRLHHGHARQHHVTPIHHPHLVGSVRERFGGEKEQGGVLKRLRERQKQSKTTEATKEGTDEKVAQKKVEEGQQQIITQPPNLVDGRK